GLSRISQRELPLNQVYTYPTSAGKDVDIYIVDSGVDINNPDFEGRAEWGANFVKGSPDLDEAGHGTLVAGIAAGASVGVAKKANIISVKCLGKDGNGNIEDIIEGLHYILKRVENNHSQKHKKSIVNISLSSDKNIALNQAVDALSRAGVIVVAAAGNSLPSDNSTIKDSCQKSPASSETAITVGSTDDRDQLSHFSNTGKCVNILAPGEGIISENKDDTIVAYSGTSYSAPHVAGILAIYWSQPQHKNKTSVPLNKSQVIDQLYQLATPNIIKNVTDGTPNLLAFVGTESTHSKLVSSSKHPSQTNQSIKQMPGNLYILYIFIYLLYSFYIVI
ncbi:peptidase S8/S53 domain-containing protein, partial [Cunninghamella echinulata]